MVEIIHMFDGRLIDAQRAEQGALNGTLFNSFKSGKMEFGGGTECFAEDVSKMDGFSGLVSGLKEIEPKVRILNAPKKKENS